MKNTYSALSKQKEVVQIVRFLIVGVVSAIFDLLLFVLLNDYYKVNYLLAGFISTLFAILLNYYISKKWVFSSGKYSSRVEFIAFMVFSGIGVVLNSILIWLFVEHLLLEPTLSKGLAIGIVAVFNFITKKMFVFKG
ncbi:GtrA family protein [Adhaeribacter rhizoryzae]|uniref:GtrA family protein n=1 Tax=Adhaeribacter rhizoryzae TaxID=2607907 RepID=A0A5M6DBT9_9BACT|nr:GtrA family protein [Adhaeribacter rhizoryzae]KAA5545011.1 GtrA family protein [Adhaeribacter rhizoryzae]